jgi:hypothetical protein
MYKTFFACCFLLLCLFYGQTANAQTKEIPFYPLLSHIEKQLIRQAPLFNGAETVEYPTHFEGNPYFGDDDYWENAELCYDGRVYYHVPLYYDRAADQVILLHNSQEGFTIKITPNQEKISYFMVQGHRFVNLASVEEESGAKSGFYDLLYDGSIKLYAKRKLTTYEVISGNRVVGEFRDRTRFFLWKEGVYYPVKNKASLVKLFKDQKKPYQQFLREEGFDFYAFPEQSLIGSARFLDPKNPRL